MNSRAVASPMPLAAPVMTARFPSSLPMILAARPELGPACQHRTCHPARTWSSAQH
jgi:hypothetical protein